MRPVIVQLAGHRSRSIRGPARFGAPTSALRWDASGCGWRTLDGWAGLSVDRELNELNWLVDYCPWCRDQGLDCSGPDQTSRWDGGAPNLTRMARFGPGEGIASPPIPIGRNAVTRVTRRVRGIPAFEGAPLILGQPAPDSTVLAGFAGSFQPGLNDVATTTDDFCLLDLEKLLTGQRRGHGYCRPAGACRPVSAMLPSSTAGRAASAWSSVDATVGPPAIDHIV